METLSEKIMAFLAIGSGYGSGYGSWYGSGDGDGDGSGYGSGYGSWSGSWYGDGYGSGYGSGSGDGDGSGSGDGIKSVNGESVYMVDGIQTIIRQVSHGFASGAILNSDLTLTPCFIAKGGNKFAHGETLKKAVAALQDKLFEDMPEEDRIAAFVEAHPDKNKKHTARNLWIWHNRLTGSCEMGRNQFARDHNIDLDNDMISAQEFIDLCCGSYGGEIIGRLEDAYAKN